MRRRLIERSRRICRERAVARAELLLVELCARIFGYYAHRGEEFLRLADPSVASGSGTLLIEPLGVVFGIQPWRGDHGSCKRRPAGLPRGPIVART